MRNKMDQKGASIANNSLTIIVHWVICIQIYSICGNRGALKSKREKRREERRQRKNHSLIVQWK
jgi:hypothetical protein